MVKRFLSSQLRINMVSGLAVTLVDCAVLALAYRVYLHYLGYERYGLWLVVRPPPVVLRPGGES